MAFTRFDDPTSATLVAYWSATESSITKDGSSIVSDITSVYGSAHPLVLNSNGSDPTYHGVETLGSMPAFHVSLTNVRNGGFVCILPEAFTLNTDPFTIVCLEMRPTSSGFANQYNFSLGTNGVTTNRAGINTSNSNTYRATVHGGSVDSAHTILFDQEVPVALRHSPTASSSVADYDTLRETVARSTVQTASHAQFTYLASQNLGADQTMRGTSSIVAVYSGFMSDADIDDLFTLMRYWRDNNEAPSAGPEPSTTFGPVSTNDDPSVTGWQWEESADGNSWADVGTILTDISGATTTTLTVNSAPIEADQTRVRCRAFSAKEPTGVVSHSAILTVQGGSPPEGPIILYETDFNSITDWTTGTNQDAAAWGAMYTWDGYTGLPNDFYAARQTGEYNTRRGYGTGHETVEILAANADKARGGTGKSFVYWREARETSSNEWAGDGLISIYLPTAQPKLYIEFDICFSEDLVKTFYGTGAQQVVAGLGGTKMFRVRHWNGSQPDFYKFFWEGDEWSNNPKFIWDIASNDVTGYRNYISCRARGTDNFSSTTPPISSNGDKSYSWIMDTQGTAVGGGDPKLIDKRDGTTSVPIGNSGHYASPDEIIGSSAHPEGGSPDRKWSRLAFFVQMNSAPGVADGRICQWLDDERTMNITNVEWIKDEPNCDYVEWNVIEIGGNNNFSDRYPDECTGFGSGSEPEPSNIQHQEWYSVDNLKIYSDIPGDRGLDD